MLKSRELLERRLTSKFRASIDKRAMIQEWIEIAKDIFAVPETISSDYITLRKDLVEADEFLLFIFCDIVLGPKVPEQYYTKSEIETYYHSGWHVENVQFPIEFEMTRINDEQYIGKISVKDLMKLKDAQLINYNENAQRTMRRIVRGETEYYQISLNKDAVRSIMESFKSDMYIPNTITLNLPETADYYYDDELKMLIIRKAEYLDILDGYHRYIAMSKVCNEFAKFDYEMELRVVQFSEEKARRFIWQEDQKTKMSRVDSEAMDTAKASNKIVARLNNSDCIVAGNISRNSGIINAAQLANAIDVILLKGKGNAISSVIEYTALVKTAIDYLVEKNPKLASEPWHKKLIFMMIFELKYGIITDCMKDYKKVLKEKNIYASSIITQSDVTRTKKLLGKES